MTYQVPVRDIQFVMKSLAPLQDILALPACEEIDEDLIDAIVEENARFTQEVVAPLNRAGDTAPPLLENGTVTTSPGYRAAFEAFSAANWQSLPHKAKHGGQGLPHLLAAATNESLHAACLSFALCPMLTDGVIDALSCVASSDQQARFLPPLLDGRWTGTMVLTEPGAGSDLAQIATYAVVQSDGSYRLFGQKIFITYGEHDFTENILHLVLARVQGQPGGAKGLSLFAVPKVLCDQDGHLGARNDVWCASLEHKLGIHGSPTAMLIFGDGKGEVGEGAVGYLIGEMNRGLAHMFIVMNSARFSVGLQGVAVSERSLQLATNYAQERLQGQGNGQGKGPEPIIYHPDVQRMLMTMKSHTEAMRALAYTGAAYRDMAENHGDAVSRASYQALYEFLIPVIKGYCTETALEVTSLGVQVHGGMGFIEETGAAQHYRDARILPIYEGTTAIQANDLLQRKILGDKGAVVNSLLAHIDDCVAQLKTTLSPDPAHQVAVGIIADELASAAGAWREATQYLIAHAGNKEAVLAGSVPYLMLTGQALCGWNMARAALVALQNMTEKSGDRFDADKFASSVFYAAHILPRTAGNARGVQHSATLSSYLASVATS